jgi:hypothetical protein
MELEIGNKELGLRMKDTKQKMTLALKAPIPHP